MATKPSTHVGTLPLVPDRPALMLLVETWQDGSVTVATRSHPWETWSPPTELTSTTPANVTHARNGSWVDAEPSERDS